MISVRRQFSDLIYLSIIGIWFLINSGVNAGTADTPLKKIENTPGLEPAIQKLIHKETEWYEALDTDVIHIFDLSGKELTKIKAGFYSISPDGKLILSRERKENSFQLFNILGNKLNRIQGEAPDFSPNGKCFTTLFKRFIFITHPVGI
jgi:hypothetical protein